MHYGLRKASSARFLLLSRCIAFPVQNLNALWPSAASRARLLLFSRNTGLEAAIPQYQEHATQVCHAPLESFGLTALATAQSAQGPASAIVASCLGAYSNWFSGVNAQEVYTQWVARSDAFWGAINECPNPSIEGTSNGGAHWFAPSRSATPLAAPHVKR